MINLTTAQAATVAGPVSEPQYLVTVDLDTEYNYTTRDEVATDDRLFIRGGIRRLSVSNGRAEFGFYNEDFQHTQNVINGIYRNNPVSVWWAYGAKQLAHYVEVGYWEEGYTEGPDDTTPGRILIFTGVIDQVSFDDECEWLRITAKRMFPTRTRLLPPFANFLPSAGYVLQFDGQILKIEGRK